MSANYPWIERDAKIEHDGLALNVTMRKPEGSSDGWELRAIRAPSSCTTDSPSINLLDWMIENMSKTAMDEIEQLALAAIAGDEKGDKEASEIARYEARVEAEI